MKYSIALALSLLALPAHAENQGIITEHTKINNKLHTIKYILDNTIVASSSYSTNRNGTIYMIWVSKEHRGQGYRSALLYNTINQMKSKGATSITYYCKKNDQKSRQFVERNGFKITNDPFVPEAPTSTLLLAQISKKKLYKFNQMHQPGYSPCELHADTGRCVLAAHKHNS